MGSSDITGGGLVSGRELGDGRSTVHDGSSRTRREEDGSVFDNVIDDR
jgi:hypothetical protein